MATPFQVTFDAVEPAQLGAFWAELLGYVEQPPPPGFDSWDAALAAMGVPEGERDGAYGIVDPDGAGPRLFFQRVPEGKTAKNRVHLDVGVSGGFDVRRRPAQGHRRGGRRTRPSTWARPGSAPTRGSAGSSTSRASIPKATSSACNRLGRFAPGAGKGADHRRR